MKKILLSMMVSILATTASAFVGNDGPQAAPQPPPVVLVERVANGGFFVPPGGVYMNALQIFSNGLVVKVEYTRGDEQNPKSTEIATLSADKTAKIAALVSAVAPGKMVDPNPNMPPCQDAPMTRDTVYQGGKGIDIAETSGCKSLVHENANAADKALIRLLNAIEVVATKK